ncbi:lipase 3-like isoform X5 [Linepithema humile]|uniref:lipase 3-like isoform X5 n=1 Tax=Linepithema humile TaxID=83485 RepID=UPI00351E78FA
MNSSIISFIRIPRKTLRPSLNPLSMMQPTAIVYFLSLCGFLGAATVNVTFDNLQKLLSTALNDIQNNVDANLNTLELIRRAGYPAEAHVVLTEDGYLLTIHRIPGGKNSPVVFLQHCLLCSSAIWIIIGKEKALPYKLADQGYDVWLGNFRGNTYSKTHISLSPSNPKFWNFSYDKMGTYDLPAMISYVTNLTSKPVHTYIGYSIGTTTFYVMAIKRPEFAKMVRVMISLAPVAFVGNMTSLLRLFAPYTSSIEAILRFLGINEFLPKNSVLLYLARVGCNVDLFTQQICGIIVFLINGFNDEQFDYDLKILRDSLPNIVEDYRVPFPKFNHADFLLAKDAPTLVFEKVLEIVKNKVN